MKLLQIAIEERNKVLIATGGGSNSGGSGSHPNSMTNSSERNSNNLTSGTTIGPIPNLATSVQPPWERATTPANVPYYIK